MAYTPYYPGYYQPQYYQPSAMPDMLNQIKGQYPSMPQQSTLQQSAPAPSNDMLWVLGEVEATSYPVAPNATVILWDKNQPTLYIKSVNAQGVPSMRILDYSERTLNPQKQPESHVCKCGDKFVSKSDFQALQDEFDGLKKEVQSLTSKSRTKTKKEEEENA